MNPYNKDGAMFLRPRKFVQICKKKNGLFLRRHTLGVIFLCNVPLHTDFYKI